MSEEKLYTSSEARLMVKVEELEREVERLKDVIRLDGKIVGHWQEKMKVYHKEKAILKYTLDWRDEDIKELKSWLNELLEKGKKTYEHWYYNGIFGVDTTEEFAQTIKELHLACNRIQKESNDD